MASFARRRRFLPLGLLITLGCWGGTGPDAMPEGSPDFRGTITRILDDGGYLVDDGSGAACGFALVYVSAATDLRWRVGGRASTDDLRVGRRVSVWQSGEGQARCSTVEARAVVIEQPRLWS